MQRNRRWFVPAALGGLGLIALGATLAGAQGDDTRRGTDPLSTDEVQEALDAASAPDPSGEGAGPEAEGDAQDDIVLLVERRQEDKDEDDLRRADVFIYSYADDTLTGTLVDLSTGEVDSTETAQDVQLPLVTEEGDRALAIALDDAELRDQLETEYRAATGRALADPAEDLDIQPIVFRADSMPTVATGEAANCGRQRCAQLLIQTTDHVLINLLPIVNLSEGRLISRNAFFDG